MSTEKVKKKPTRVQAIRVQFTNGSVGEFIGRAVVESDELEKVGIAQIELGEPEDFSDEIRDQILNKEGN